jgi:hypothetical protein
MTVEDLEAITNLFAGETKDTAAGLPHFKNLLASVAAPETNVVLRVKILQALATYGYLFEETSLREIMEAIVKVLSTQDDSAILVQALKTLVTFSKKCVEIKCKKAEFVVRESLDLLMQLHLDTERPEAVRQAAANGLPHLAAVDFRAVVMKLFHWLSDDRGEEDMEYLATERQFALETLSRFVLDKAYESQWTDDVFQSLVTKFLTVALPNITFKEFNLLVPAMMALPQVKAGHGTPLLDAILAPSLKFKDDRLVDMLLIVASHLPKGTVHDGLAQRLFQESSTKSTGLGKVVVYGARFCSDAVAEKNFPLVSASLTRVVPNPPALGFQVTDLEGILVSMALLGNKAAIPYIDYTATESVKASVTALKAFLEDFLQKVTFSVKRLALANQATAHHASLLTSLSTCVELLGEMGASKVPSPLTAPSWERKCQLPKVKRSSVDAGLRVAEHKPAHPVRAQKRPRQH